MTTIKLPLFDLKYNTIHKDLPHSHCLELYDTHIAYSLNCYMDDLPKKEDGEYEVKEMQFYDSYFVIPKTQITGIISYYCNKHELYVIEILSATTDICPKFETREQMIEVREEILDWFDNLS